MFIRVFLYPLFISAVLSCSCLEKTGPPPKPVFPDKDLKEVIISGWYAPENKAKAKAREKELRSEGRLKEWESFEEKYSYVEKESFNYAGKFYCYNETQDKKPVFNKNLRVRLYDKKGQMLTEDYLRLSHPEDYDEKGRYSEAYLRERYALHPEWDDMPYRHLRLTPEEGILSSRAVISYLPYHDEGHELRIVKLQGRKEVLLKKLGFSSQSELREISYINTDFNRREGWVFDEESECHIPPPFM